MLKQISKIKWLQNGDLNTAYYHKAIKARKSKNALMFIHDSEDHAVFDPVVVSTAAINYFKSIIGTGGRAVDIEAIRNLKFKASIKIEGHGLLTRAITEDEVRATLFSIEDCKSPGSNSGVNDNTKIAISDSLGIGMGSFPVKYLRLSLLSSGLKKGDCQQLIERLIGRIYSWQNRYLSGDGSVIDVINRIYSRFLWHGSNTEKKHTPIAWKSLCYPKKGGLGFKCLRTWNKAAIMRQTFRLAAKEDNILVA
ncbi:hypothetical protein GIB67_043035 [Kingdonia uniflora]|uniref:Uncharacterized protein n=1 Tax=Kingdonia uniflora TaxID=39325 RepID=A0A7J7NT18_9MAGN|nr:hypothetical protein GIB67_043035 [Kingdonia uniflora]